MASMVGATVEDPALLTGWGRFVDDIQLPGPVHMAYVRNVQAHARITVVVGHRRPPFVLRAH